MYELNSKSPGPTSSYEGVVKNVTGLGFQEDGKWMYTGGEDNTARIWDLRSRSIHCQRMFQVSAPVNCVRLHPNQTELVVGDQSGIIHLWDLNTDHNEQLVRIFFKIVCFIFDLDSRSRCVDSRYQYRRFGIVYGCCE